MEKLTNEQIVQICDNVIKELKEAKKRNTKIYLCVQTKLQISRLLNIQYAEIRIIRNYIPLFMYKNAKKYVNAKIINDVWWDDNNGFFNYSDRIKFMQWIKEQYQN